MRSDRTAAWRTKRPKPFAERTKHKLEINQVGYNSYGHQQTKRFSPFECYSQRGQVTMTLSLCAHALLGHQEHA